MLAAFHFPTTATEDTYALEFTTDGDEDTYTFRFYFNPVDNLWKRDILVHLDDTQIDLPARAAYPSGWYWMRRGVEPGNANFLILAQEDGVAYDDGDADPSNDFPEHPDSASGSTSVIDLFSDDPFWGSSSAYDTYDPLNPVHIDSPRGTGGMNAVLDPFPYTTGATITAVPDVTDTFNFWHYSDPADADFTVPANPNVVDFGPDSGSEKHGDWGFHPFMPQFTITTAR